MGPIMYRETYEMTKKRQEYVNNLLQTKDLQRKFKIIKANYINASATAEL